MRAGASDVSVLTTRPGPKRDRQRRGHKVRGGKAAPRAVGGGAQARCGGGAHGAAGSGGGFLGSKAGGGGMAASWATLSETVRQ